MIASLSGVLQRVGQDYVIVQVGGVGLQVFVPSSVFNKMGKVGQPLDLLTYLVVREDSLTLYGFATEEEKIVFDLLMDVSGVGPRTALAALDTLSPQMLANAIQRDEPDVISRIPGVGRKTAQKVILELKGKLVPDTMPEGLAAASQMDTDIIDALTSMGFSIVEAQAALQSIPRDAPEDIEERVRIALNYFGE